MLGFGNIAKKVFGSRNDRKVKGAQRTVDAVKTRGPRRNRAKTQLRR